MKKRDYRAEYRRKKERRKQAQKEARKHFKIASEAMKAVSTGYRQSHAMWSDDLDKAQRCIKMVFDKKQTGWKGSFIQALEGLLYF